MTDIVSEIVEILGSGITGLASKVGSGLNSMVTSAFIDSTGDTKKLSAFGGVVCVFAAVSLAIGLTTLVTRFIMNFGN